MSRPQWKDPWSTFTQTYGQGTISGSSDGWDWFGHSGGFQGYITRTSVVPEQSLAISCLTNAVDGMGPIWLEGALAILKRFQEGGAPGEALADWRGRWWSVWGATDLVAVGEKVLATTPALTNPVAKTTELTVTGPDEAQITQTGAFGNQGETVSLVRGANGLVSEVRLAGGRLLAEADLAAELTARYEG
jgi:D-alanyl-D-alanine carboxypeptidase